MPMDRLRLPVRLGAGARTSGEGRFSAGRAGSHGGRALDFGKRQAVGIEQRPWLAVGILTGSLALGAVVALRKILIPALAGARYLVRYGTSLEKSRIGIFSVLSSVGK